jgi:hypothetical protein
MVTGFNLTRVQPSVVVYPYVGVVLVSAMTHPPEPFLQPAWQPAVIGLSSSTFIATPVDSHYGTRPSHMQLNSVASSKPNMQHAID